MFARTTHNAPSQGHDRIRLAPEFIRVGYVTGAHGLRGAVRVKLENPDSLLLKSLHRVILARDGETAEYVLTSAQPAGKGAFKLALNGVTTARQAVALRGTTVMVAVADLPALTGRQFYYFQVLGCEVITNTGVLVGTIKEVFSTGANDVWVVRNCSAERLLPVIEEVVKEFDVNAGRVIIEPIPGLLD